MWCQNSFYCQTLPLKVCMYNNLALNDSKTEAMHFSSRFSRTAATSQIKITVGDAQITPSAEARNLGVIFDEHMTMRSHIKKTCRTAMGSINKIGRIRNCLDKQSTLILTHAFVTSRLDSANSLLSNLPECDTNQLQRIQNISARITERVRRTAHITPILHKLHWLPVIKRTRFKVLLLTYKALHGLAPAYISELIQQHTSRRALRSQDQHLLQVPRTRTQYYGSRTFSAVAPTLWNSLPLHIRTAPTMDSFKRALKQYLFTTD